MVNPTTNRSFSGTFIDKWRIFHCHVSSPEGSDVNLPGLLGIGLVIIQSTIVVFFMLMFFFLANDMSSLNAQQPDQAHMGEHVFRWLSMGIFINQLFIFCKSIYPRIEGTICRIHRQYLRLKTIISCKISLQANHFWVETC